MKERLGLHVKKVYSEGKEQSGFERETDRLKSQKAHFSRSSSDVQLTMDAIKCH